MSMGKVQVRTHGGYHTNISARHHTFSSDVPEASDGTDLAPTPEETLLGALGSCMAMTAKMYAKRKGWDLQDVEVELEAERFSGSAYEGYNGDSNFVHEFRIRIALIGELDDDQRARIMEIVEKCPVRRMIATPAFFVEERVEAIDRA